MHLRAGHAACVDHLLDVQVGVRFERARRAGGSYSAGQVQAGETHAVLDIERHTASGRIEQVLVHADQTGHHCVTRQVQARCAIGNLGLGAGAECLNAAAGDHDGLLFQRRRTRAIDDADVFQGDDGRIDRDEWLDSGSELPLRKGSYPQKRGQDHEPYPHSGRV
jgi:hypothetical protein